MADYARMAAIAARLIAKFGRDVTVRKLSSTPVDPAKPWQGNTNAPTDIPCKAVLLRYEDVADTSDNVRRGDKYALVSAVADLRSFTTLIDGAETWKIENVKPLDPGDTVIYYRLDLKR